MNKFLTSLLLLSSLSMAGVHQGLKDAIDKNDMKKATAIVEKLGIMDVYCPASLSVANGQKLYGARFAANPDLLYATCAKEFVTAYTNSACTSVENANFCKSVLDKTPADQWLPMLKSVKLNKLDKVQEEYIDLVEVEDKGPKKSRVQCLSELENSVSYLSAFDRGDEAAANKMLKDCMNGKTITTKKVKKKRLVNPFEKYFDDFGKAVLKSSSKLLGFNEDGMESIKFVKTLEKYANVENDLAQECIKSYKEKSYISDKLIVKSCRFSFSIDKLVEKEAGFQLFSCKNAVALYGSKNVPACALTASNELYTTEPMMAGAPAVTYSCSKGIWTEASAKQVAAAKKKQEMLEAKQKAEEEAKRKAEEKAERDAKRKAELEAKKQADEEAKRVAEEKKRAAEEKKRIAEEEKRAAEEEKRIAAEEAKRMADEEAKRKAEEDAKAAQEAKVAAAAEALKGSQKLKFKTNPAGAIVSINGELQDCTTPCSVELPVGSYDVMFSLDQYMIKDTTIAVKTIKANKIIVYTINLDPADF